LKAPVFAQLATVFLTLKGNKSLMSPSLLSKGEVRETAGFWTLKAAQLAGTDLLPGAEDTGKITLVYETGGRFRSARAHALMSTLSTNWSPAVS